MDEVSFAGTYLDETGTPVDIDASGLGAYLADELLQAARRRFYKPEYVACPGCGRTMYDLQAAFEAVKARTGHLKNVVIAVMGCIVNGPGEMADADWGYVGEGNHKVSIYKGKTPVLRHIPFTLISASSGRNISMREPNLMIPICLPRSTAKPSLE